jgi:hypothetical protein
MSDRPVWAVLAAAVASSMAVAAAAETQVSVFAGQQFSDGWEQLIVDPANLDWQHSGIVGVSFGREWPVTRYVSVGFEAQVVQHAGAQDHAEFDLPLTVRYATDQLPPLRSLAFGMGPSYATKVPPLEVENKGSSQQALLYWSLEAEFASPLPRDTIFTRLHHRSNGWGAVAEEGGSNVLVMGLRHRW